MEHNNCYFLKLQDSLRVDVPGCIPIAYLPDGKYEIIYGGKYDYSVLKVVDDDGHTYFPVKDCAEIL